MAGTNETPDAIKERRDRLKNIQAKTRGADAQGASKHVEISDAQMMNLPQPARLHGLEIVLQALPSGAATAELQTRLNALPVEIIAGALTDPPAAGGGGIDWQTHGSTLAKMLTDIDGREVAEASVPLRFGRLWFGLSQHHNSFAEAIYPMATHTPGVEDAKALAALFAKHFNSPMHYIDLVRVVWAVSGGFPGDIASRFVQPSPEPAAPV